MSFNPTWFLLQQEGFLAQACLCNGLTALRQANVGDKKGLYYSAFFELSIGLERMMKLIIILDHMALNNLAPPDGKVIDDYKHNLIRLFDDIKAISKKRGITSLDAIDNKSLQYRLLSFLDRFAHPGGRYANINKLTGHKHQAMADPLVKWGEIATQIIRENATQRQRQRANLTGQVVATALGNAAMSLISDLNQSRPDVRGLFTRASELETAAKHAIFALVSFVAALRSVLEAATHSAQQINLESTPGVAEVPGMEEFFQFAWPDKKYVMRKRRWP